MGKKKKKKVKKKKKYTSMGNKTNNIMDCRDGCTR